MTEPKSLVEEGTKQRFTTRTTCPLCNKDVVIRWESDKIPYLGEVMYVVSSCQCGFRYADTLILEQGEPTRYELHVCNPDDLNARVVRSTAGTLRLPELGMIVEPGPASESFVSNVEGVLQRAQNVLKMVSGGEEGSRALELLGQIEDIRNNNGEVTLIIEDPTGNSAILSQRAKKTILTSEEAGKLKMGAVEFKVE